MTLVFLFLPVGNQVKRSIEIMDKNSIYLIDLIEKIIYVTKQGSLQSKKVLSRSQINTLKSSH